MADRRVVQERAYAEARARLARRLAGATESPLGHYVPPRLLVEIDGNEVHVAAAPLLDELGAVPGGAANYYRPAGSAYRCQRCASEFDPEHRGQAFCSEACKRAAFFGDLSARDGHA